MTKSFDDTVRLPDWLSKVLDVGQGAQGAQGVETDSYTSVRIDSDHYSLLTGKLCLLPSTLARVGMATVEAADWGRCLSLPLPLSEGGKLVLTGAAGFIVPERRPLVWRPQVPMHHESDDGYGGFHDHEFPTEFTLVSNYIADSILAKGWGELCPALLKSVGLTQHYGALHEGDVELHKDPWDMMVVAQAKEVGLFEAAVKLAEKIDLMTSPERADSILRAHEPCLPALFVCLPFTHANMDGVLSALASALDLVHRRIVLTLTSEEANNWAWWEAVKVLDAESSLLGLDFAVRVLPACHNIVGPEGVPWVVSTRLFISRFGVELYESLPLRRVDKEKVSLGPEALWRTYSLEARSNYSAVEMGTLEIVDC